MLKLSVCVKFNEFGRISATVFRVRNIILSLDVKEMFCLTFLGYFCIAVVPLSERMTNNGRQGSCVRFLICDASNITATVAGLIAMSDFIVSTAVCLLTSVKNVKYNDIRDGR